MIEILDKRQYTSKTFDNGDGTFTLKAHAGHIHYKGTDNSWKEVDFTLEDMGTYWRMVKASYKLLIAKDFGANELIRFQNKYRGANHQISYEPKMLAWVNNPDMSDMQVFRNQQSVTGHIVGDNVIRYDNAFGDGIHFEITLLRSGFKKEIVIDAKNKLELPPTANHKLVALFKYDGQGLKIKSADKLREWNKIDYFEETAGFRIQEEANEVFQSFIRPAYIIDEGGEDDNQENIKVFWKLHNGSLWQAKVLPKQFLLNATYPVRADTTTSYYSGAGDGPIYDANLNWSTLRNQSTGNEQSSNTSGNFVRAAKSGATYYLYRGFLPFDTSSIGSGNVVTAATINLYVQAIVDGISAANSYIAVVQTDQASASTLSNDDFNNCGDIDNPTEGGDRLDYSSVVDDTYNTWDLNATGLGWVNVTGNTLLGLRDGYDTTDTTPTGEQRMACRFSEYAGTDYDPYLEVTYSAGGSPSSSESPSPSASVSPSSSASASVSPSSSESASVSPSSSESSSPSSSTSASVSPSSSVSSSPSSSASSSVSPSSSVSSSPSASPSPGTQDYTKGDYATLAEDNDDNLENTYTGTEITNVSTDNDVYTDQTATGEYAIHQFKDTTNENTVTLNWKGKTTQATTINPVILEIYNRNTTEWENVDSEASVGADTEFILTGEIADLTNYKDGNGTISCRVYQNG
jgi:hypothetical protein